MACMAMPLPSLMSSRLILGSSPEVVPTICWIWKPSSRHLPAPRLMSAAIRKVGLPRAWRSGSGTCDWNWDNSSLRQSCAPPHLLPHWRLSPLRPSSPSLLKRSRLWPSMVLLNRHVPLLLMAFPAPRLRRNQMDPALPCQSSSVSPGTAFRAGWFPAGLVCCAYWRLSWEERLTRNARPSDAPRLVVTLHGLPTTFAHSFGFDLLATA